VAAQQKKGTFMQIFILRATWLSYGFLIPSLMGYSGFTACLALFLFARKKGQWIHNIKEGS